MSSKQAKTRAGTGKNRQNAEFLSFFMNFGIFACPKGPIMDTIDIQAPDMLYQMVMNRVERIQATLKGEKTDRIPGSIWYHYCEIDQDPRALAERSVEDIEKYDFDFIKLMPFGLYNVQDWGVRVKFYCQRGRMPSVDDFAVHQPEDWGALNVLPPVYGTLGKALQTAQYTGKLCAGKIPFVQTIFSPLTTARKLAGERIFLDMKESPSLFKQALEVITETTIGFVRANIEAGVSGFFFASQCAAYDVMTEEEYIEFGRVYDLKIIDAYKDKTCFNIVHIHGANAMFNMLKNYPVNCINWHDRNGWPSLAEAKNLTDKCLMGGLEELPEISGKTSNILNTGSVEELENYVHDAIRQTNGRGFILGPGCVADPLIPEKNIFAIRRALSSYRG
jgi:uroporphyrinogen decarboxylase